MKIKIDGFIFDFQSKQTSNKTICTYKNGRLVGSNHIHNKPFLIYCDENSEEWHIPIERIKMIKELVQKGKEIKFISFVISGKGQNEKNH
jgi:hypothetical protein